MCNLWSVAAINLFCMFSSDYTFVITKFPLTFASFSLIILLWPLSFHSLLEVFLWLFFCDYKVSTHFCKLAHLDTVHFLHVVSSNGTTSFFVKFCCKTGKWFWLFWSFVIQVGKAHILAMYALIIPHKKTLFVPFVILLVFLSLFDFCKICYLQIITVFNKSLLGIWQV